MQRYNMSGNNYGSNLPYGYNGYRHSGGRNWGMSQSMPPIMDNRYNQIQYPAAAMNSSYGGNPMGNMGGGGGGYNYGNKSANNYGNKIGNSSSNRGTNSSSGSNDNGTSNGKTNLIVNYLPQDMADQELYAMFRRIGPINTCKIMRDYKTGYSFGYAFVDFGSEADSASAIKSLNGVSVRNKRLKVSYARPGGDAIKDTKLYVSNLPRTIDEDELENIFSKHGSIVQKSLLRDKLTGKPRGVAFIRYGKREDAQNAIKALNNSTPEGHTQKLNVRLAEEHGKARAAHFLKQMSMGGGPSGWL